MNLSVWLIRILNLLFAPEILSSRNFSSIKSFEDAVNTLEKACRTPPTCDDNFDPIKPTCCGECMCTENCFESGTCCLRMYDNFTHARLMTQKRRSSCVLSQYLPYKHTDFPSFAAYVFVTTCDRESTNDDDIYMCETSEAEIETVVPVTEPVTNVHYKNRYCAYCNNVDKSMQLISWKLQIHSSQYIFVPRSDFLEVIRRTRSNIIFVPPGYVEPHECFTSPDYTIETCNQTGLWQKYDELIETACELYTDAFNFTYKNFFCFLCNADTSEIDKDWECKNRLPNNPAFSVVYDLNDILEGHTTHKLVCNDSQFLDENMMVCRDIFCDEMHILFYGKCDPHQTKSLNKTCFSVFMKLTSLPGTNFATRDQMRHSFFSQQLFYQNFSQIPQQVKFFFKTNDTGYIEYFVAFIVSIFPRPPHMDEFLEYVILMSKRELHFGKDAWRFSVELVRYDMTVSDQSTKLLVRNLFENSFDELTENFNSSDENICSGKETVQLSKLNTCPHIRLRFGELPMKIELDFLLFLDHFEDNKIIKMLSKWEYEMQGETIKICFKDYLIISNAISRSHSNSYSSAETLFLNRVHLSVFVCFSIHQFLCFVLYF